MAEKNKEIIIPTRDIMNEMARRAESFDVNLRDGSTFTNCKLLGSDTFSIFIETGEEKRFLIPVTAISHMKLGKLIDRPPETPEPAGVKIKRKGVFNLVPVEFKKSKNPVVHLVNGDLLQGYYLNGYDFHNLVLKNEEGNHAVKRGAILYIEV